MGLVDNIRNGAARALLGGELAKLREAQDLFIDAYRRGPALVSPETLVRRLQEFDSHLLDLILQQAGYERITAGTTGLEWLTETNRRQAIEQARYMTFYDAQSRNAVQTWTDFGFGQRVTVEALDPDAEAIWSEFWTARRNAPLLKQRRIHWLSNEATVAGELVFVLWSKEISGLATPTATLRRLASEAVTRVVTVEDDPDIPLWYVEPRTGSVNGRQYSEVWYPDWQATADQLDSVDMPANAIDAGELREGTDCVAIMAMMNETNGRGWPGFSTAYDWFSAYRDALQDVLAKNRAVAMFVDKLKVKGGSRPIDEIAARLTSTLATSDSAYERNPARVPGSTWLENEAADRTRMPLGTAAGDDRIATGLVLGQGYAGTGIPLGLVRSDFFQNRSVAEIAMEPWYETMQRYQTWWTDVWTDMVHCVLGLAGWSDPMDVEVKVTLESPMRSSLDQIAAVVNAAVAAARDGVLDPEVAQDVVRAALALALQRVGVRDAELLADEEPEGGAGPAGEPEPSGPGAEEAWVRALRENLAAGSSSAEDVAMVLLAAWEDGNGHR